MFVYLWDKRSYVTIMIIFLMNMPNVEQTEFARVCDTAINLHMM